ncbi:hypothetical protein VTK26DRAFT_4497 [Humicola hyalothermophila]
MQGRKAGIRFEPHQSSGSRSDGPSRTSLPAAECDDSSLAAESRANWFGGSAKPARATTRRGLVFDQDFPLGHQAALQPGRCHRRHRLYPRPDWRPREDMDGQRRRV